MPRLRCLLWRLRSTCGQAVQVTAAGLTMQTPMSSTSSQHPVWWASHCVALNPSSCLEQCLEGALHTGVHSTVLLAQQLDFHEQSIAVAAHQRQNRPLVHYAACACNTDEQQSEQVSGTSLRGPSAGAATLRAKEAELAALHTRLTALVRSEAECVPPTPLHATLSFHAEECFANML